METYPFEVEEGMRRFYHSLNEKDRRRFAGWEALRFGPGGRSYIAQVLGCSRNTISKGAREVSDLPTREVEQRIRVKGGGRKRYTVTWGPVDLGVSIRAEITDPDGLTIELREWKHKPW